MRWPFKHLTPPVQKRAAPSVDVTNGFAPYRIEADEMDLDQIYESDRPVKSALIEAGLASDFSLYERLLDFLDAHRDQLDVQPLAGLLDPLEEGRIRICLRHDVDSLISPALLAAKALHARQMIGSFYLLHTANYYGIFLDGVFRRHFGMEMAIDQVHKHKQEVGLHIDPLHVYYTFGINGAEAMISEIEWIRSLGINVAGVVAHNSAPVYGAENFEIFEEISLNNRKYITYNGITVPLGSVSMESIGIQYEGNFPLAPDPEDSHLLDWYLSHVPSDPLRRSDWLCVYLQHNPIFKRSNEINIWLIGNNFWVIADGREKFFFNVTLDDVKKYITLHGIEKRVVIILHPEYICA